MPGVLQEVQEDPFGRRVRNDIDKIVRGQTIGELPAIVKNLAII